MATKSIQDILTNLTNDVADLAAFVNGTIIPGGTVPANIAAALSQTDQTVTTLQKVAAANPFVLADVAAAFQNANNAINALGAALANPSTP